MPEKEAAPILIARIGAAHGIKGEVRVKPFGEDPLTLADYSPLSDKDGASFVVKALRQVKGGMLVVRFAGIDDRNTAETLNGRDLFVPRDRLADTDDDEFYQADLIGCDAVDEDDSVIGTVVAVPNYGAGDLLEIAQSGAPSMLVPFTRDYVPAIDLSAGKLTVARIDDLREPTEESNGPSSDRPFTPKSRS